MSGAKQWLKDLLRPYLKKPRDEAKIWLRIYARRFMRWWKKKRAAAAISLLRVPVLPKTRGNRALIIVDVEGWAWHQIACKLAVYLNPGWQVKVQAHEDFLKDTTFRPNDYSVVMVYTCVNKRVLNRLQARNTLLIIERDPVMILDESRIMWRRFKYFAAMNGPVYHRVVTLMHDKHVYLLTDGADPIQFTPGGPLPDEFTVGWVGQATRDFKRFALATDAVSKTGFVFKPLKGSHDNTFTPHEEMPGYYEGIDCLLITSTREVHSAVMCEAMMMEKVVIATRAGDAAEVITHMVNGLLLPYDCTADDIAEMVEYVKSNPEHAALMGEAARETIVKNYSWPVMGPKYAEVWNTMKRGGRHITKRKVGFLWWYSPQGDKLSVIAMQKQALEKMGVQVTTYNPNTVFINEDELTSLNDNDFIFTSILPMVLGPNRIRITSPIIFQIDGYGDTTFYERALVPGTHWVNPYYPKVTHQCEIVTFLDLNVYEVFRSSGMNFDWEKMYFIPNGIKRREAPEKRQDGQPYIGHLLKENKFKKPWVALQSALHTPDIEHIFPLRSYRQYEQGYTCFGHKEGVIKEWPDNVKFIPLIDHSMVPHFIKDAEVFVHYSGGDACAKTINEAFSVGVAPVVSDIVRVQGVHIKDLPSMLDTVGYVMPNSYRRNKAKFYKGNGHHLRVVPFGDPQLLGQEINKLRNFQSDYKAMGENAQRWADEWFSWEDKWEALYRLAEIRRIV